MAKKRVVIVKGSPRKAGNSAILAKQVAEGAKEAGAKVESFYLHGMKIRPCTACDKCQKSSEKGCVIDDEMRGLYPKLRRMDALVIATPIYWFTMSAQAKVFLDRCYALGGPEGNELTGKRMGIVLTYADPDPYSSGAVNAIRTFQDAFRYIDADLVGIVYGTAWKAGEIKANKEVMKKAYELGQQLGSG